MKGTCSALETIEEHLLDDYISDLNHSMSDTYDAVQFGNTLFLNKMLSTTSTPIRDEKMTARIMNRLKNKEEAFVAVGASHLIQKDNIITRLRSLGVEVTEFKTVS